MRFEWLAGVEDGMNFYCESPEHARLRRSRRPRRGHGAKSNDEACSRFTRRRTPCQVPFGEQDLLARHGPGGPEERMRGAGFFFPRGDALELRVS